MRYLFVLIIVVALSSAARAEDRSLRVGFAETDITPTLDRPVYLAGYGKNRRAQSINDPIMARGVVLHDGARKIAIVSVDLVGLFHPVVERVRARLSGFAYVLVSSTHNHEGPDTLGLWGPNFFQSGVDPAYLKKVEDGIVATIEQADKRLQTVQARIGSVALPELLSDSRLPVVKHDELIALEFVGPRKQPAGIVVQWNCHPEFLGSRNTAVSADYVWATVAELRRIHDCPVVYLTGTVGGLLAPLRSSATKAGEKPGDLFAQTERYGRMVGQAARKALAQAQDVDLTPFAVRQRQIFLPLDNQLYLLGWKLGVLDRRAYRWTGDVAKAEPLAAGDTGKKCVQTEIAHLRLGQLDIACIPGEIYPELVLGKVPDPAEKGADFPDAAIEPSIYEQLKGPHRMIVGLANDEIGYIIPKRQWDEKPPFCYGRKTSQYGEINSLGPETAPLLCEAFRELLRR